MGLHQYIGARYVPIFYENSVDGSTSWEANVVYEPMVWVTLPNSHMYLSKKQVPATVGSPADNIDYWLDIGSYNGIIQNLQDQIDLINDTTIPDAVKVATYNNISKFDLDNTGATDCSTYFASVTDNVGLQAGTYLISNDCTINAQLVFAEGATLNIDSGVTVTINGQILAGRYQIFSGSGDVVVDESRQDFGYPEWFNNDVKKCYKTFRHIIFGADTYYLNSHLKLDKSNTCLEGVSYSTWDGTNACTRLHFGASAQLQVGITGSNIINDFPRNITVKNMYISSEYIGSIVAINGSVRPQLENLYILTATGTDGIIFGKSIGGTFTNIYVQSVGISGTFYGFRFRDFAGSGIAGDRSASNWLTNCSYGDTNPNSGNTYGFFIGKGQSDIFLLNCEVAGANVGLGITQLGNSANVDILISQCDFDACRTQAISISNCANACIHFSNCYGALATTSSGAVMIVSDSTCDIVTSGMQLITTSASQIGLQILSQIGGLLDGIALRGPATTMFVATDTTKIKGTYLNNGVPTVIS